MRFVVTILTLLIGNINAYAGPQTLDLADRNHQLHVATAYSMTLTGGLVFKKLGASTKLASLLAGAATMSLGMLKEATDEQFSNGDMVANGLGTTAAVGMIYVVTF